MVLQNQQGNIIGSGFFCFLGRKYRKLILMDVQTDDVSNPNVGFLRLVTSTMEKLQKEQGIPILASPGCCCVVVVFWSWCIYTLPETNIAMENPPF